MLFKIVSIFITFVTALAFFSEKQAAPSASENFRRHISFQAGKLGHKPWDPEASFGVVVNFQSAVFTNLVNVDAKYKLTPGLIKEWKWDFKTNSILFTIDRNFKFDEKRGVEARDVEYALLKSFLSDFGTPFRNYLVSIKGVDQLKVGQKYRSGMCSGIKVISENELQVTLTAPNPNFIYTLQNGVPPVAPVEDFASDHFNFKGVPRGTGPYFIEYSSQKTSLIRLKLKAQYANNSKYDNVPLSIDFFNHGNPVVNKVDLATAAGTGGLKDLPGYTLVKGTIPESISTIDFNYSFDLAKDKNFREAIALSIKRSDVIAIYRQSRPVFEVIPSKYMGRIGGKLEYSAKKAKEAYKKVSKKPQTIKAIFHGTPGQDKPYITILEKQINDVGVPVKFDGRSVLIQFGNDKDAILKENGNSVSFTDPISAVARFIPIPGQKNLIAYPDPRLTKLFTQAVEAKERTIRAQSLQKISKILNDEFYTIPLFESFPVFTYNSRISDIDIENRFSAIDFLKVKLTPAQTESQ